MRQATKQTIIDGAIEYLISEGIIKRSAKSRYIFDKSYIVPNGSVVILGISRFLQTEKVNIEIDREGKIFDRLFVYYQNGRRIYTKTNYKDFMEKYLKDYIQKEEPEKVM